MFKTYFKPSVEQVPVSSECSSGQPPRVICAARLLEQVEKFRQYVPNWGTYNEPAINQKACDRAQHFISYFAFHRPAVKLHVYPTAGGDIGLDCNEGEHEYTVVFSQSELTVMSDVPAAQDMCEKTYTNELALLQDLITLL